MSIAATILLHGDLTSLSMLALAPAFKNDVVERGGRIAADQANRSAAEIALSDYPMLVTSADSGNPAPIAEATRGTIDALLGNGVKVARTVVEPAAHAVTQQPDRPGSDFWQRWGLISRRESHRGTITRNPIVGTALAKLSRDAFTNGTKK